MLKLTCLLFLVLLLTAHDLSAAGPSFTPLPDLPGGDTRTFVIALSANGEVAVGQSWSDLNPDFPPPSAYPFRWTRGGGMVALGGFPGTAYDVSPDGLTIVGWQSVPGKPNPAGAFRWTAGTGIILLEGLSQTSQDFAYSVSSDGRAVGGQSANLAVRWTDSRVMDLGAGFISTPVFISADGSVVAGTRVLAGQITDAFRWTAGDGAVSLGQLPGHASSSARDMTPDGGLIVGISQAGVDTQGFRWTADRGMVGLGSFYPRGVSNDGRVMIGSDSIDRPVIWFEGSGAVELQPLLTGLGLDLTGWSLGEVRAISGDGTTIAGQGIPPDPSMSGAWVATIPEPSTWLLGGIAFAAMIGFLSFRFSETWDLRRP